MSRRDFRVTWGRRHESPGATTEFVTGDLGRSRKGLLPQVLLMTALVTVVPIAASLALRLSGIVTSPWLSIALAVGLSFAASSTGSAYWRKHRSAGEVLFSDLLLWGWVRRQRQEQQLASATTLLGLVRSGAGGEAELPNLERREQLLRQLATTLEAQDLYLNGHSRRVARHATMIARGMGLPSAEVDRIRAAAAVHDIGKVRTPKWILNKPGRLTDAEFEVIKRHPVDGAQMVSALADPELTAIVRHHHERLDGSGYPDGLSGEEIPIGARIIAVADTFDAITSTRAYRAAAPHHMAIEILRKEAGSQLDPAGVRAFLGYYSGHRPTLVWVAATAVARRLASWLSGDSAAAATFSAGKLAAATAATAVIGAATAGTPVAAINPFDMLGGSGDAGTQLAGPLGGAQAPTAVYASRSSGGNRWPGAQLVAWDGRSSSNNPAATTRPISSNSSSRSPSSAQSQPGTSSSTGPAVGPSGGGAVSASTGLAHQGASSQSTGSGSGASIGHGSARGHGSAGAASHGIGDGQGGANGAGGGNGGGHGGGTGTGSGAPQGSGGGSAGGNGNGGAQGGGQGGANDGAQGGGNGGGQGAGNAGSQGNGNSGGRGSGNAGGQGTRSGQSGVHGHDADHVSGPSLPGSRT
jgi:putative nucleotidyltransferase with HDIG domain